MKRKHDVPVHPDKHGGSSRAAEAFQRVHAAHAPLSSARQCRPPSSGGAARVAVLVGKGGHDAADEDGDARRSRSANASRAARRGSLSALRSPMSCSEYSREQTSPPSRQPTCSRNSAPASGATPPCARAAGEGCWEAAEETLRGRRLRRRHWIACEQ